MSAKRALVCALMPEPDRDSGSRRVLHLIEFLQELGWAVSFVSHHAHPRERYVRALQQRGIGVYAGSKKWMDPLIATGEYGLAVFGLWDIAAPYVPRIRQRSPATRILVDSIDLHFLRKARQTFGEVNGGGPARLNDLYAAEMIRELNTYAAVDGVLAVSQKEADLINDLVADRGLAHAVPDGEDLEPSTIALDDRRGMVFVGCYRFPPNAKAVEYLCGEILPRVDPALLERHPVYLVGDGLDNTIRALGDGLPGVRMVGWVPSVEPYLKRARISIVPLLYGAGTKRKVLQALMYGSPTVSTSIGAEGLDLEHGKHLLVADDPTTFAEAIDRLLTDDALWRRLEGEGRAHMAAARGRGVARESVQRMLDAVFAREVKRGDDSGANDDPHAEAVVDAAEYEDVVLRIHEAVQATVPAYAGVAVVSKGDPNLLDLGGRRAWHFPKGENGQYAGYYPADSDAAVAQLAQVEREGATHVLFPATALWWLDHYAGFKRYLDERYDVVLDERDTCVIYARRGPAGERPPAAKVVPAAAGESAPERGELGRTSSRLIAFLLPQFHPIPENDAWWGKGFTEWTNVTNAQPLFAGHYQPRLPADLGFYDLRMPEVWRGQAELARAHGIDGFCYYHFWFGGKRLLERPFNEVLRSGEPDFPFCLCWANEPWSRRWDGWPRDVLQPQSYSADDDVAHIRWLVPALTDRRAIQIEGKPVFIVYQAKDLPDSTRTTDIWREEARKAGLTNGLYLMSCETGRDAGWDATAVGFDAKVQFQPQFSILFGSGTEVPTGAQEGLRVFDYQRAWPVLANPEPVTYRRYDSVFPSWDNTARAGRRGVVLHNSTPEAYQAWLEYALSRAEMQPPEQRLVFINAWNEWAEGCHLEPDQRHSRAYLEATKRAVDARRAPVSVSTHQGRDAP